METTYAGSIRGSYAGYLRLTIIVVWASCFLATLSFAQDDDEPTSSAAQTSTPFVDQTTGLKMERFFGARTSFGFSMALPLAAPATSQATSFIGQLSFPLVNGQGWGAMGLTGDMVRQTLCTVDITDDIVRL